MLATTTNLTDRRVSLEDFCTEVSRIWTENSAPFRDADPRARELEDGGLFYSREEQGHLYASQVIDVAVNDGLPLPFDAPAWATDWSVDARCFPEVSLTFSTAFGDGGTAVEVSGMAIVYVEETPNATGAIRRGTIDAEDLFPGVLLPENHHDSFRVGQIPALRDNLTALISHLHEQTETEGE